MKFHTFLALIFICLFVCTGCAAGSTADEAEPEEIEVKLSQDYTLATQLKYTELAGTVFYNGNVIVCNPADNDLVLYTDSGEEIDTFGSLGNEVGEFINPTGIAVSGEYLYVLDAGNQRIQIYDADFTFLDAIPLDQLENTSDVYYTDLSVTDAGGIYLTTNSTFKNIARVYLVDANGKISTSAEPLYGFTYSSGDTAYCINTFQLSQENHAYTASFADSYLYSIKERGTLTMLAKLPFRYGPTDFVVEDGELYVLSCGWARLDHFTTDGTYLETIYQFDELDSESYLTRTSDGFVVTDRESGTIYFLSYEQK